MDSEGGKVIQRQHNCKSSALGHIQEVSDGAQNEAGLPGEIPVWPEEAEEEEPRKERQ